VKNRKRANGHPSHLSSSYPKCSPALVRGNEIKKREFLRRSLETLVDTLRDVRGYPDRDVTSFSSVRSSVADHEDAGFSLEKASHRVIAQIPELRDLRNGVVANREARRVKPGEGPRGIGRLDNSLYRLQNGSSP
jgi:hypothetical protein